MSPAPTPTRYLLDEHLRGALWDAIKDHNADPGNIPILAVRVGDLPDLPLGIDDATILRWAERKGRVLVSCDKRTMATHFRNHLAAGAHSPGVFLLPNRFSIPDVIEYLALAAFAAEPSEWIDQIKYYS